MLDEQDDEFERVYDEPIEPKGLDSETLKAPMSVLAQHRPYCVTVESPIGQAIRMMQEKHIGAVLVVDGMNKLVGIFTERDVIQKVAGRRLDWDSAPVSEVMTPGPESLKMDDMIAFALNFMHMGGYRHVPVVDEENRPIGIVSIKDFVAYLAEYFPQEVVNLPPEPLRKGPDHRYGG